MIELRIERAEGVNADALNAHLLALSGYQYFGFSTEGNTIIVYLAPDVSETQQAQVVQMVMNHNPNLKTPQQEAEEVRVQNLKDARTRHSMPLLTLTDYASTEELLQKLAEKISWLEQEMHDLRRNVLT